MKNNVTERAMDLPKFEALVHYICSKARDPACLGSIKLNKVLWYSDSVYYLRHGVSITGETYVKRQHGPVPKHVLSTVESLVKSNKIARGKVDYFGFVKSEFIALEDADLSKFTAEEISHVDEAFEHVCMKNTARSISDETHGVIWGLANMGEVIPLYTVFASRVAELDETDFEWAQSKLAA